MTIAETGLPGSPKTRPPPGEIPNQVGFPGRSATPQKTCSAPSSSRQGRTWSCSPTETPPQMTVRSASRARSTASRVASRSSPACPIPASSAPAARASAGTEWALELRTPPGRIGSPGAISSSPVASTRTRGSTRALDPRQRGGGDHAQLRRADQPPRAEDPGTGLDVLPGAADVGALGHRRAHLDAVCRRDRCPRPGRPRRPPRGPSPRSRSRTPLPRRGRGPPGGRPATRRPGEARRRDPRSPRRRPPP